MSTLSVDKVEPVGSTLTFGQSGDSFVIPSGATFTNNGTATGFAGKIVQVLEDNLNTSVSSSSTSYVASGLSIAITNPASTGSRFLLTLSGGEWANDSANYKASVTFYVDGSEVSDTGPYEQNQPNPYGSVWAGHSAVCLHSPSTTSAVTYAVYYKAQAASTAHFNRAPVRTVFTVMEISA